MSDGIHRGFRVFGTFCKPGVEENADGWPCSFIDIQKIMDYPGSIAIMIDYLNLVDDGSLLGNWHCSQGMKFGRCDAFA